MTRPRDPQSFLLDLVNNTLDPGYTDAAGRRAGARSRWDRPLTALGCALAGFVLVVALIHQDRGAPAAARVHADLVTRVQAAQDRNQALTQTVQSLDDQLNRLRAAALGSAGQARLTEQELLAGVLPATGPGLRVTLSEPTAAAPTATPGRAGSTPIAATHIITDRDVRAVVNQLWSDGAEAVAVNGVRLNPVSAIRFAGEAVLVDFQPVAPPYRIDAIGKADRLDTRFADSAVASRYKTLSAARGIGFNFTEQSTLTLPAAAPVAVRQARPAR